MKSFLLNVPLSLLFGFFLFFRSLDLNFFFRNGDSFNCCSLVHKSLLLYSSISLFVQPLIMPANYLILLSFIGIQNIFGKVTVICNSPYFITVNILTNQFFSILYRPLLTSIDRTSWPPCNTLPQSDIHVL